MYIRALFGVVRPASHLWQTRRGVLHRFKEVQRVRLVATAQSYEQNSGKRSWWNISTEWKIVTSVVVAATSFYLNAKMERQHLQKELKLKRIESQIKELYGPLYGNRLVSDTSYRAVMINHKGLKKYLHEARLRKDADMIHRWRSYVWDVLYPLDKKAVEMLLNNAHLVISDGHFPEEFEQLLVHTAKMEFVIERWKADDGSLLPTKNFTVTDYLEANNGSGIDYRTRMSENVREKYKQLSKQHKEIMLEITSEKQTDDAVNGLFKKFANTF